MAVVVCSVCAAGYEVPGDFRHPSFKCGQCGAVTRLGATARGAVSGADPSRPHYQRQVQAPLPGDQDHAPLVPTSLDAEQALRVTYDRMCWSLVGPGIAAILLTAIVPWGIEGLRRAIVTTFYGNAQASFAWSQLAIFFSNTFFVMGQIRFYQHYIRTGEVDFEQVFRGGRYMLRAMVLWCLALAFGIVVLAIPVAILFVMFDPLGWPYQEAILPVASITYVWLTLGFVMAPMALVDRNLGIFKSIQVSWRLMAGNRWQLILLAVVLAVMCAAGTLLCGVGVLPAAVVALLALNMAYFQLAGDPAGRSASGQQA